MSVARSAGHSLCSAKSAVLSSRCATLVFRRSEMRLKRPPLPAGVSISGPFLSTEERDGHQRARPTRPGQRSPLPARPERAIHCTFSTYVDQSIRHRRFLFFTRPRGPFCAVNGFSECPESDHNSLHVQHASPSIHKTSPFFSRIPALLPVPYSLLPIPYPVRSAASIFSFRCWPQR
jgi:hypothetical protein